MSESSGAQPLVSASRPYALSWIVLLGLLTALGPLSIDMYLPALPNMARFFAVDLSTISNTVPAYFFGLAIGQLFYGPISDRFGRKPPLYVGLTIFVLASVACALATDWSSLLVARVFQALGGCVGVVVARSAIRDCLTPAQSSQAYAMLLLVMGVAPILAPLLGGVMLTFGWDSIFWFLAAVGVLCLLSIHWLFAETLEPAKRQSLAIGQVIGNYLALFKDTRFSVPALIGGCLMGALFVYISASSALLMGQFGVSAQTFGWLFGMNAAGLIALSQLNGRLVKRLSLLRILQIGTTLQVLGAVWLLLVAAQHQPPLWSVMVGLFVIVSGIGLTAPNSTALALADQGARAGTASALLGAIQFGVGLCGGLILHQLPLEHLQGVALMMSVLIGSGSMALLVYSARQAPAA